MNTEWLVSNALGLKLATNSRAGYDGITNDGIKIQIKGRRITPKNKSRKLSAIRKFEDKDFDKLAAVIFDENFNIIDALLIPREVVGKHAKYRAHQNAHILEINALILRDSRVISFKDRVSCR